MSSNSQSEDFGPIITVSEESYEMQTYRSPEPPWVISHDDKPRTVPSKLLYVSHFLSTWNTRGFEFGAILFLATIYPGTLLPMSVYALGRAAAAILFSYQVGRYIDTRERLSVVRLSIIGQRAAVVFSCAGLLFLLIRETTESSLIGKAVFGVLVLLAAVEKLCSIMNTVAVERDWVVVIAGEQGSVLQELNSQMRRIDLFCKLVAPLAIALIDGTSTKVALLVTIGLNIVSVVIEYPFIAKVYRMTPALARKGSISSASSVSDASTEDEPLLERTVSVTESLIAKQHTVLATLKTYTNSAAFMPSFALSMLYLTVLSFSGQMTTFLLAVPSANMTSTTIGLLRTISTIFELSATYISPWLMGKIGAVRAGIWCLSWQVFCLTIGVGLLWSPRSIELVSGTMLFVIAVILSRIGLWGFDLVAQLLIQNSIDSTHRGAFSTAEASLQNFFELCTFALTIVFSRPADFKIPALVSLIATYCAAAVYAKFVRDRRGHLLHMPSCLKHVGGGHHGMVDAAEDSGDSVDART